jgi:uncharacterized membrane protein
MIVTLKIHDDLGNVSAEAVHQGRAPICPRRVWLLTRRCEALVTPTSPERKNIQAIMGLERETRGKRSVLERITDGVRGLASSPAFIFAHILWFAVWIGANSLGRARFDAYPFSLLTLAVSLEAIVLTGFVLMAQTRMTQQADKRAHLDLQINLLAEQELTAILKMQCLLAERAGIDVAGVDPRLEQLRTQTDVQRLAAALDNELASVEAPVASIPTRDDVGVTPTRGEDVAVSDRGKT